MAESLPPKILLVEDDPQFVYLLKRYAGKSGCQLLWAEQPGAAVAVAQQEQPDLVILDMLYPEANGGQVLRALAADPTTRHIPVVLCSSSEAALQGWKEEADGHLLKPVLYDDFINLLVETGVQ